MYCEGYYNTGFSTPLLDRGSRGDRMHFLTDRYKGHEPLMQKEGEREVEIVVGDGELSMIGFYDEVIWQRFLERLKGV